MEPVFDQTGKVVAWLRGDHVLDPRGGHVAFLRNNWLITYRGVFRGRFYRGWFRDLKGAAVGFMQRPSGLPTPPATEPPPPPPEPAKAPMPPLIGLPPMAVRPMPVWSKLEWDVFVGVAAEEPPPAEPGRPSVAELDLTMTPSTRGSVAELDLTITPSVRPSVAEMDLTTTPCMRDVMTTPRERPALRLRRPIIPAVEEAMTLVRAMSKEELDEFLRRLSVFDVTESQNGSASPRASHARG